MSVCSQEETDQRYTATVSDIDPDEYNHTYPDTDSDQFTEVVSHRHKRNTAFSQREIPGNYVIRSVYGQERKIPFFETSTTPYMYIRDAVTGAQCAPYRVGTLDEELFFSVILSTGELGQRGPFVLFYDNPEQYEKHMATKVSKETKHAWFQKVLAARNRRKEPAVNTGETVAEEIRPE